MSDNKTQKDFFEETTLTNKLIKKWFWLYFFAYLIWPIWYFVRIIISNDLTVSEVWVIYSIISFVWLISSYNGLWLTESLRYFIPKFYINKQFNFIKTTVFWALLVQILTSILIIILMWFGSGWLAEHYFSSPDAELILKYFCFYFFFINLFQIAQTVFISFQDTFSNKFIDFIKMIWILIFTLILFFLWEWTIITYSISRCVWLFFSVITWYIIYHKKYKSILNQWSISNDKEMLKKFVKYSSWTFLAMNAWVLMWAIDQQMVIIILWPESAGYFTNYQSLLNMFSILIWPIFWLLFPLFTELFSKKQTDKIVLLRSFLYNYLWIFCLSLATLFIVLWPEISSILFGTKFIQSWKLLSVWAIFYLVNILYSIWFIMLASLWKVKQRTIIMAYAIIINLSLNLVLLNYIWMIWAILSTAISGIFMVILSSKNIDKKYNPKIDYKFIFKNLILFVLLWIALYFIKDSIFAIDNNIRFRNLAYLCILWISYYWIIASFNFKKIRFLRKEIKKLKNINQYKL